MARHLAAFYQNATITALTPINAVPDTQIFTSGTIMRVPAWASMLCMAEAAYVATALSQAEIETPTLRTLANLAVSPLNGAAPAQADQTYLDRYDRPVQLTGNENMTFSLNASAGAPADAYGLVEFCDGAVKPDTRSSFTIGATGAAALSAGQFVNTGLVFDSQLPAGSYDVVGLRAEGTNLVAARLVFIGQAPRPGVPGTYAATAQEFSRYRQGASGVFGSFDINQPPTVDCLGITDTAQRFYLDLVKTK